MSLHFINASFGEGFLVIWSDEPAMTFVKDGITCFLCFISHMCMYFHYFVFLKMGVADTHQA